MSKKRSYSVFDKLHRRSVTSIGGSAIKKTRTNRSPSLTVSRKKKISPVYRNISIATYHWCLSKFDDVKFQLPTFGRERLSSQFDYLVSSSSIRRSVDEFFMSCDNADDSANGHHVSSSGFCSMEFASLVKKFLLRGYVSPFVYSTSCNDDDQDVDDDDEETFGKVFNGLAWKKLFVYNESKATTNDYAKYLQRCRRNVRDCYSLVAKPDSSSYQCCSAFVGRLIIFDSMNLITDSCLTDLARNSEPDRCIFSNVLIDVGKLLYRKVLIEDYVKHFDVRACYRRLRDRTNLDKTRLVQSMEFYRRIFALHAIVFVVVLWLHRRVDIKHQIAQQQLQQQSKQQQQRSQSEQQQQSQQQYRRGQQRHRTRPIQFLLPRHLRPIFARVQTVFISSLRVRGLVHFLYV